MDKQFELVLTRRDPEDDFKFKSVDKIMGNSIMEILTQFNFVLVRMCEQLKQEALEKADRERRDYDDIPF